MNSTRIKTTIAVAIMALAAFAFAPAQTAGAASPNGGVYGITSAKDGWCKKPRIAWVNHTTGRSGTDYSRKDDIFWMPVRLGTQNSVTVSVYCGAWSGSWYGSFKPTRNKQSVFFRRRGGAAVR